MLTGCTSDEISTCTGDLSRPPPTQSAEFERYCQSVDFRLAVLLCQLLIESVGLFVCSCVCCRRVSLDSGMTVIPVQNLVVAATRSVYNVKNSASLVIGIMTDRNHVSVISYDFLRAKEVM